MKKLGIIGGSGLYTISGMELLSEKVVNTDYGNPSDSYKIFNYNGAEVVFLSRHGQGHGIAPHEINYRANIAGFKELEIDKIVSISATGGITRAPGDIVIASNAIDFTSGRAGTYASGGNVFHVDMTHPFCHDMRTALKEASHRAWVNTYEGISICTNGPRLETAAEIAMFKLWGADIVGMTLFPECTLARELGMCYANLSAVTNFAAGVSLGELTSEEVVENMQKSTNSLQKILINLLEGEHIFNCTCSHSMNKAKISK